MADLEAAKKHILQKLEHNLPANLYYHGLWHTNEVVKSADQLCEFYQLGEEDALILKTAAAYHDSGFLTTYKNHEEEGCIIAKDTLPEFGYSEEQISAIQGLIMATKVPQSPNNFLQELICDADLDYLGGNDYARIADLLYQEFKAYHILESLKDWLKMQVSFLEKHCFFSSFATEKNNENKLNNLNKVKLQLTAYENTQHDEL